MRRIHDAEFFEAPLDDEVSTEYDVGIAQCSHRDDICGPVPDAGEGQGDIFLLSGGLLLCDWLCPEVHAMKAVVYEQFGVAPAVSVVPDPTPETNGVVIGIEASGVCRSDYSGWKGHDPSIELPQIPGHELAGVVEAVGRDVRNWKVGDRVTVPFVGGCGSCPQCHTGNQQVCDDQFQPGFTHWGSFAQFVEIQHADLNLVGLPDPMDFATAASLGCRFITSFRAVVDQGRVVPGEWVAVHGCGGVGLSAIMIARALGARPIAIDISEDSLALAKTVGAEITINGTDNDVVAAVKEATGGGANVSLDALGIESTCVNSVRNLAKRGRHVQVGWMLGDASTPPIPMDMVMGNELEIIGSHGMQAHRYGPMLDMISSGVLDPQKLISEEIDLAASADALANFGTRQTAGISVITDFS